MSNTLIRVILAVLIAAPWSLYAQEAPDSGTVEIIIQESMGMLDGFRVSSAGRSTTSDATGKARLILPVGHQRITVTRIGFKTAQVNPDVAKDSVVTVTVAVSMNEMSMELEPVKVSATRTDRLAGETPIHVEIIDQMEVDENTLMSPSGISMLLNETPGLRVHGDRGATVWSAGSSRKLREPSECSDD